MKPEVSPQSHACETVTLPIGISVHLVTEVLDRRPVLLGHAWVCGFICADKRS